MALQPVFTLPPASLYAAATSLPLCWRYLCEGAAHAVFSYAGPPSPLSATVLRVSKGAAPPPPPSAAAGPPPLSALLSSAPPSPLSAFFPRGYLPRALLLPRAAPLHPPAWLGALRGELERASARAPSRAGAPPLPADCALQLAEDAGAGGALVVELKPKCGLRPLRGAPCRFCATQLVKAPRHRPLSLYCPLEVFSGDPRRVEGALARLVETPQNNLRVFRGGELLWGGEGCAGAGGDGAEQLPAFGAALLRAGWPLREDDGGGGGGGAAASPAAGAELAAARDFLRVCAAALCAPHSPLPPLLAAQALCGLAGAGGSAEGAAAALAALAGEGAGGALPWAAVERELLRACAEESGGGGGAAPALPGQHLTALVGFLLAATAIDASVMMAVDAHGSGGAAAPPRAWHEVPGGGGAAVAWAVVDTEVKSAEKVDAWVRAEGERRDAWARGGRERFEKEGKACAALAP
jgi:hypothetical protein